MGDVPSKYEEPLRPLLEPLWTVDPRFCVNREVTLLLKEKMWTWSGDDYSIKDANTGQMWFKVSGRAFTMVSQKKTLLDVSGQPVLNIKHQWAWMEQNYKIFRGGHSEEELFKVVAQVSMAKAKMHTTILNRQTNQPVYLTLKGNYMDRKGVICIGDAKQGGIPIAKIYRPRTGREFWSGQNEYFLTIAPNVDISMVLSLCVCFDEMKND